MFLLKFTKGTTENQKLPKMGQNSIISPQQELDCVEGHTLFVLFLFLHYNFFSYPIFGTTKNYM